MRDDLLVKLAERERLLPDLLKLCGKLARKCAEGMEQTAGVTLKLQKFELLTELVLGRAEGVADICDDLVFSHEIREVIEGSEPC